MMVLPVDMLQVNGSETTLPARSGPRQYSMNDKKQCWFCGKGIVEHNGVDPCEVTIYSNADKPEDEQTYQAMWCHIECFRKASKHPSLLRDGFFTDNSK